MYPELHIHGENFHPGLVKALLSRAIQLLYLAGIVALLVGDSFFLTLGLPVPAFFRDAQQNKMMYIFALYFIGNALSSGLMNSGAFEVTYNDKVVWSKLATGRLPAWEELLSALHHVDPTYFRSPGEGLGGGGMYDDH